MSWLKLGQKRLFHYALLLFARGQSFRRLLDDSPGPLTSHHVTRSTRCQSIGYWVSDKQPLTDINNWRKVTPPISRSAVANLTYRITALYSGLCPGRVCRFETFRYPASWSQRSSESSACGRCVVANGQCLGCGLFQLFPASSRRRRYSRSLFRPRRHDQSYAPRSAPPRPRCA